MGFIIINKIRFMTIQKTRAAYLFSGMALMFFTFFTTSAVAQQPAAAMPQMQQTEPANYSDEELEQFVEVTEEIIEVQKGYQQQIMSTVKESGYTMQEFQVMAQQQQSGKGEEMTAEEKETFNATMQEVMGIQQKMNQEMQEVVQESDMDMQSYQQMAMQIRQSPELSEKVQNMMKG